VASITPRPVCLRIPEISSARKERGSVTDLVLANHTVSASILGLPGISLPVGLSKDGLPIGVELDAALGTDHALLALAQRIEGVLESV
jgi:Asp-tRNA(Asn)/Glu-tRNA(Gln) amidotransferase A subunit family amidase